MSATATSLSVREARILVARTALAERLKGDMWRMSGALSQEDLDTAVARVAADYGVRPEDMA